MTGPKGEGDGEWRVQRVETEAGMGELLAQSFWKDISVLADGLEGQRYISFMTSLFDLSRRDLRARVKVVDGKYVAPKKEG